MVTAFGGLSFVFFLLTTLVIQERNQSEAQKVPIIKSPLSHFKNILKISTQLLERWSYSSPPSITAI